MVITTKYVLIEKKNIIRVIHDSDGDWQFLTNDNVVESDALVVSLQQILEYDESISELLSLPRNKIAIRENKNSKWIINNFI
ncbi:hypothetical protein [Flavobacterium sp.]|uniref:hypothetical protein n=1 Tax=Flavobacterium sp. TaxID=239 RepID=UPI0038FCF385